jgi:hypothetical protein
MSFVPPRFLVRVAHPCRYVRRMPLGRGDDLLGLSDECRVDNFAAADGRSNFADVRLAWNESGIGVQVTVTGKSEPPAGDPARPRYSDGMTVWFDTRGDRTSHRASRTCHQFHLLAAGGGGDRDESMLLQTKINRAQADAPMADLSAIPFRRTSAKKSYRLEAFFAAAALHGFDPDEHPRLGFFYSVRDQERGEQLLTADGDFPFADDPSLWGTLVLDK